MDPLIDLIGTSAAAEELRTKIERLFQRRHAGGHFPPILVDGETGTGKGLVARLIHRAGPRADGPFMPVNCAAIPETLLESELFGFERGAFTDARRSKRGLFQSAHRGVLFLDEISRVPAGVQVKLLTAIEERWVRALGRTDREAIDVWIVAATNVDLAAAVRSGLFREDLYHRLAVLRLHVPPLRERREDILLLAEHFLELARREYDLPERRLTGEARAALVAYAWPGNIRELGNVMERVALLSDTPDITAAMLGLSVASTPAVDDESDADVPMEETIATLERRRIVETLEQVAWNV
ncbi:MAG: sigma-54-dependent Fis family transcriptional regulator, partial [Candidatus Rokubacteria bacterium]|nr:sigma-54-dependent Fis family transcriptional regulator [Candidatus Rokubacteria bacterium]